MTEEEKRCPVCYGRKVCKDCGGRKGGCPICDFTGKCSRCKGTGLKPLYQFEKK